VSRSFIRNILRLTISTADDVLSKFYLNHFKEKNALIIFYFHGILDGKVSSDLESMHPQSHGGLSVEYFLGSDYVYVSPDQIPDDLSEDKNYIMLTFDDGYYNNHHVLPVLNEYNIPAVFFISANHVRCNKSFWWDALYRGRIREGASIKKITEEINKLKNMKNDKIESYLSREFGKKWSEPMSDIDRPFTLSELKDFSQERHVFLGNHTNDHALLTNYTSDEVMSQIINAQDTIFKATGIMPSIISYPSGMYSEKVIRAAKNAGLRLGLTIDAKKNYLPINNESSCLMMLGRFSTMGKIGELERQCRVVRSDVSFHNIADGILKPNFGNRRFKPADRNVQQF
jgi:peptidoglycan/xylan/chitin deacetylase (PgdA/CDA1 family)